MKRQPSNKEKFYIASLSGGKDSTAMVLRLIEENRPIDMILFCDTGIEYPEMYNHLKEVEEYIKRPITVVKAEKDFMYWARDYELKIKTASNPKFKPGDICKGCGWPHRRARWCTDHLKDEPREKLLKPLREKYDVVEYVGIAADEAKRAKAKKCYPLIEWGMTEADCLKYCKDRGFQFSGLYDIWDRVSCFCCPIQSIDSLRNLYKHRQDLWQRMKDMDAELKETRNPHFKMLYDIEDLERRFEVEEEFLKAKKPIKGKAFFNRLKELGIEYNNDVRNIKS